MSTETNKTVVRRYLDEAISRGDLARLDELCAADLAWPGVGVGDLPNREALKQVLAPFLAAFPDRRVTTEALVAEGDQVVARYTWRGTHAGEFFGIPPTGKTVAVAGTSVYRLADGKVAESWWQEDVLGLMQQLGAIPVPNG